MGDQKCLKYNNTEYYRPYKYSSFQGLHKVNSMHGAKRVITFCLMTAILPTILIVLPLYLRHVVFADTVYPVAESDILEIVEGVSTIFCQSHSLQMNTSFNAFQLKQTPTTSRKRKHIRLKKSMTLPDDTLEYWGFYLLKGATVLLKVCSRYEGARILVVRGEKNLRTCGLMEHNKKKFGAEMDHDYNQVKVTFESAQEIKDNTTYDVNATQAGNNTDDVSSFIQRRLNKSRLKSPINISTEYSDVEEEEVQLANSHQRHLRKKFLRKQEELYRLQHDLQSNEDVNLQIRPKRNVETIDRHIQHGGNALNYSGTEDESSVSSFETDLLTCYNGQILLTQGFSPSHLCTSVHYLEKGEHMQTAHDVASDGYYYYIFYSDNDFISNDIHAIFDIYKPTLQYTNLSKSKECINSTYCKFPLSVWSDESVIVEVPTRDGIEHEGDDITFLISTCHPRMSVYIVFPISVMLLILGCAFL